MNNEKINSLSFVLDINVNIINTVVVDIDIDKKGMNNEKSIFYLF